MMFMALSAGDFTGACPGKATPRSLFVTVMLFWGLVKSTTPSNTTISMRPLSSMEAANSVPRAAAEARRSRKSMSVGLPRVKK